MTDPKVPDHSAAFAEITSGLAEGAPAFSRVQFNFDSAADLREWAARFGLTIPAMEGQPYPDLVDPAASDRWLINICQTWNGTKVHLVATDPITDAQRQYWIDSGWAARMAAHETKDEVADPTGLTYSREADDPTPVSPARGGPVHTGVLVDGGELVDVTPAAEPKCTPACDAQMLPDAPTGLDRNWHSDDCPVPVGRTHYIPQYTTDTMCGLKPEDRRAADGVSSTHDGVDCQACIAEMPF